VPGAELRLLQNRLLAAAERRLDLGGTVTDDDEGPFGAELFRRGENMLQ
jgi:hypothetical protein